MDKEDQQQSELGKVLAAVDAMAQQLAELRRSIGDIRQLVGPFGVPMPDGLMLVQSIYGIKYLIDPRDLIMAPQLIVYRQWEADLSQYFWRNSGKDTIFVDVGANFGYFTCLVGSRIGVGGTGRVIAIEPNPHLSPLLRSNTVINWSMCPIELHCVAAGASNRTVELQIPRDRAANASISRHDATAGVDRVEVTQTELDSVIRPGTAVDLMKIDVEGHEYGVLEGARRIISESPDISIVMEWSLSQMIDAGYQPADMIALLDRLKLATYALPTTDTSVPTRVDPAHLAETAYGNILLRRAS